MISFRILFAIVLTLTVTCGIAGAFLAMLADTHSNHAQRRLVDVLLQIALLGAGAIIALLSRSVDG